MTRAATYLAALFALLPAGAGAFDLALPPQARQTGTNGPVVADFPLPVAPYSAGTLQTEALEGTVLAQSWSFPISGYSVGKVTDAIRSQLLDEGYAILMECRDVRCGGFDFRYQIELLPEPEMHVDLGNFRFLTAVLRGGDRTPEHVQLVVSRSAANAYVQLTTIGEKPDGAAQEFVQLTKSPDAATVSETASGQGLGDQLVSAGHVVLGDLSFGSGSAQLGDGFFASVEELASFLLANPDVTVALVGHTDAAGALAANVALSRQRAEAVMTRLIEGYGVSASQLQADGVGYLSPVASNLTDEGRAQNRRVEAIITSTR